MSYSRGPTVTYYSSQEYLRKLGLLIDGGALPEAEMIYKHVLIADIKQAVCETFGTRPIDMTSARRARDVSKPRQAAMYLARELTHQSLPEIGRRFGNRDHTTVIHAIRRVQQYVREDADFRERLIATVEALA